MRGIDDTDREILDILLADGRRPYSDIADAVDLSAPAVSDRVDRLREIGLLQRFTVDLDRSMLREGVPLLVDLRAEPGHAADLQAAVSALDAVEHLFITADERLVFTATVPEADVEGLLADAVDFAHVVEYEVDLLVDRDWEPGVDEVEFAPPCVECGNTVTEEGVTRRLDGEVYHFCCGSCESQFVERYEELRAGVDS